MSGEQHHPAPSSAIVPPEEGQQPPWLMSFADFVSCLLACFVLLFSIFQTFVLDRRVHY